MMITIDPNEMVTAATTLHNCAVEAADIGSQLSSSAGYAMPPELQYAVDQLVVTVDRALDAVATRLDAQAVDLSARAQIAANDSVSAAAAAGTPGTFGASGSSGWSVDAASWMAPMNTGASAWSPVETDSWMAPMNAGAAGTAWSPVETGSWMAPLNAGGAGTAWSPVETGSWMSSLPGPTSDGIVFEGVDKGAWMNSITGTGPLSTNPNGLINAIVTGSANVNNRTALNLGGLGQEIEARWYTPTRADLQNQFGYVPTDGQLALFYPDTLDSPNSQISL